jgi:hypothetical protein
MKKIINVFGVFFIVSERWIRRVEARQVIRRSRASISIDNRNRNPAVRAQASTRIPAKGGQAAARAKRKRITFMVGWFLFS